MKRLVVALALVTVLAGCGADGLQPWHRVSLDSEYGQRSAIAVTSLEDYFALEDALFAELDQKIYEADDATLDASFSRYRSGSPADPRGLQPDWNRTVLLEPEGKIHGSVLLLHGMSDSPYSLRALGLRLQSEGYRCLLLRLPGHGTIPAGMLDLNWREMAAVVALGMQHLVDASMGGSVHIIGYSTGAALALDYALKNPAGVGSPASLVLISPAIAISPAAGFATIKRWASMLPGLSGLAWLQVEPEFDPYKYNSFATNAAEQVHRLTRAVSRVISDADAAVLPPTVVFKSTVDATVSTEAVVDGLLLKVRPGEHELVLFDINRHAATAALLQDDPAPLTRRLSQKEEMPFTLTLITNTSDDSQRVLASSRKSGSRGDNETKKLAERWPEGVFSLSHVALPFSPYDPLYGFKRPADASRIFLGSQAIQGERGILRISQQYLLRLRSNPFFPYLEERTLDWLDFRTGTSSEIGHSSLKDAPDVER
ncbi:MAG: alpha/beta fold hydrolase [Halieaceae bacterium]